VQRQGASGELPVVRERLRGAEVDQIVGLVRHPGQCSCRGR
jgi:hypothetical protein